ncbi:MAG: HisA/HisF-related TIM barrel protein [Actinobacteria bacterium]|jgi:phosphoribosylformimino-5-aminoimidazole carboxamide ribotide isomerase|nr:HisA/HisF-related TIM barrel protein [Actinomycetota bacterium]MCL6105502.1 HisA/HisF-related TIM barrel protein [Actinomycetota bacterium]
MDVYPAIDILDGSCVRLAQGDFNRVTVYGDPVAKALELQALGAKWIHVVDLNAARSKGENREVVFDIVGRVKIPVQVGGGIRDEAFAAELLNGGVARIVLGTAVVEQPGLIASLLAKYPKRIALGLDFRDEKSGAQGEVRQNPKAEVKATMVHRLVTRGWANTSSLTLEGALDSVTNWGVSVVVVTDTSKDGMMSGPNIDTLKDVLRVAGPNGVGVIASGGVRCIEDIANLTAVDVGGYSLLGVIVGRALAEGAVDLSDAMDATLGVNMSGSKQRQLP